MFLLLLKKQDVLGKSGNVDFVTFVFTTKQRGYLLKLETIVNYHKKIYWSSTYSL